MLNDWRDTCNRECGEPQDRAQAIFDGRLGRVDPCRLAHAKFLQLSRVPFRVLTLLRSFSYDPIIALRSASRKRRENGQRCIFVVSVRRIIELQRNAREFRQRAEHPHFREGGAGASIAASRILAGQEKRQSRHPSTNRDSGARLLTFRSRVACPLLDHLDKEITVQSRRFSHVLDQYFELTFGADDV
jgi:hypothetical protein